MSTLVTTLITLISEFVSARNLSEPSSKLTRSSRSSTEPDNYDWTGTRAIKLASDDASIKTHLEETNDSPSSPVDYESKKEEPSSEVTQTPALINGNDEEASSEAPLEDEELDREMLQRVFKKATYGSATLAIIVTLVSISSLVIERIASLILLRSNRSFPSRFSSRTISSPRNSLRAG
jgi:hypothetical protein